MVDRRSVVAVVVLVVLAAGMLVPALIRGRAMAAREASTNNLRILAAFAAQFAKAEEKKGPMPERLAVPAGTLVNPALPPDRRLSWVPACLPFFNQKTQNTLELMTLVDPKLAWDAGSNAELSTKVVNGMLCPGGPDPTPRADYVGLSGLGLDSATFGLGPPVPAKAGCFRYDSATPLAVISAGDGLSNTLLFAETNRENGPWLRGGPATVRGLDPDVTPYIGTGGQFGGFRPEGGLFAYADGSVKLFTPKTDPAVLRALVTIAGGAAESPAPE